MHVVGLAWSGAAGTERSPMRSAVSSPSAGAGEPVATASFDSQCLLRDMDSSHARLCAEQRRVFSMIADADRTSVWESSGARDMAHWLRMRYGISDWKARRWIEAAHALESLPETS